MKNITLLFIALLFMVFSCQKDEKKEPTQSDANIYKTVGDFEGLNVSSRNGYYPFHSPYTLVDLDIFNPVTIFANNHEKVDSIEYKRVNNDRNVYLGVMFNPFKVKYYYTNGTDTTFTRLAPDYIQDYEIRYPNNQYNQLNIANPERWVKIVRTTRREKVYHHYCGKDVNRWYYNVTSSLGANTTTTIDGLCNSQLDYQMIF